MTATPNLAVGQIGAHGDAMMCDVCGHALASHDRIAQRYCQATLHNALSRTCICPVAELPAQRTAG
jgi:rubredoxin